jgi:hypothetical protein
VGYLTTEHLNRNGWYKGLKPKKMTLLKSYNKHKIAYNSLIFWDQEVSNSLEEVARQCASVNILFASFEQKMSTISSKIASSGKDSVLKGGIQLHCVHSYFGIRH